MILSRLCLTCIVLFSFQVTLSQSVSVNNSGLAPNPSAILDASSSTKGFLIPRMSTSSITSISSPAKGLLVYDSVKNQLMVNMGTSATPNWQTIVFTSGWSLTGNGGINPSTNFIGTTDISPIVFKVNNVRSGIIDTTLSNSAIGFRTLDSITTGTHNAAFGYKALTSNKDGFQNTAIGSNALRKNTSGLYNTAAGMQALTSNINGASNTGIGNASLFSNSSGNNNTAIGTGALFSNLTGNNNTSIGYQSLNVNSTGYSNVAVGVNALQSKYDKKQSGCYW